MNIKEVVKQLEFMPENKLEAHRGTLENILKSFVGGSEQTKGTPEEEPTEEEARKLIDNMRY